MEILLVSFGAFLGLVFVVLLVKVINLLSLENFEQINEKLDQYEQNINIDTLQISLLEVIFDE